MTFPLCNGFASGLANPTSNFGIDWYTSITMDETDFFGNKGSLAVTQLYYCVCISANVWTVIAYIML